jgi:hypothetical protein
MQRDAHDVVVAAAKQEGRGCTYMQTHDYLNSYVVFPLVHLHNLQTSPQTISPMLLQRSAANVSGVYWACTQGTTIEETRSSFHTLIHTNPDNRVALCSLFHQPVP